MNYSIKFKEKKNHIKLKESMKTMTLPSGNKVKIMLI